MRSRLRDGKDLDHLNDRCRSCRPISNQEKRKAQKKLSRTGKASWYGIPIVASTDDCPRKLGHMCRTKVANRFAYSVWFLPCETGIGLSKPGEINFSSEMEHARASLSHYLRHQWCFELSVYFQTSDSHRLSWQSGDVTGTALRSFRRLPEPSHHLPGNRIHTAKPSPLSLSSLPRKKCKTKKNSASRPTDQQESL